MFPSFILPARSTPAVDIELDGGRRLAGAEAYTPYHQHVDRVLMICDRCQIMSTEETCFLCGAATVHRVY